MHRRILFANFTGLGNCIAVLGLLRAIEKAEPFWSYFHTECLGLDDPALISRAGLRNFAGTVPAAWRRFGAADWNNILGFLHANRIDTIINLRNEGPMRDRGYVKFRETFADQFAFFDLNSRYATGVIATANLFRLHAALVAEAGARVDEDLECWLAPHARAARRPLWNGSEIGFFTAASQQVKTWTAAPWIELGTLLLERSSHNVTVFAGRTGEDFERAAEITEALAAHSSSRRVRCVRGLTTAELADRMSSLSCMVSNDTAAVHIGAALRIPTIGLYFATIGRVWSGNSPTVTALQSGVGAHCRYQKHGAGNCDYFYGGCPAPCRDDIDPELVYATIMETLELEMPRMPDRPIELMVSASPD